MCFCIEIQKKPVLCIKKYNVLVLNYFNVYSWHCLSKKNTSIFNNILKQLQRPRRSRFNWRGYSPFNHKINSNVAVLHLNCHLFGDGWLGGSSSLLLLSQTGSSHSAACCLVLWKKTAVNASQYNMIQEEAAQGAAGVWVSNLNPLMFPLRGAGQERVDSHSEYWNEINQNLLSKLKTAAWRFKSEICAQNHVKIQ